MTSCFLVRSFFSFSISVTRGSSTHNYRQRVGRCCPSSKVVCAYFKLGWVGVVLWWCGGGGVGGGGGGGTLLLFFLHYLGGCGGYFGRGYILIGLIALAFSLHENQQFVKGSPETKFQASSESRHEEKNKPSSSRSLRKLKSG